MSNTEKRKIRCIVCPEGCIMNAEFETGSKKIISLEGHNCKRGIKFAENEIINPLRILTTTVGIDSKTAHRLAVRSSIPAPKDKIPLIIKEVKQTRVKAPVKMGEVIMKDALGTGVDIIASSSVEE